MSTLNPRRLRPSRVAAAWCVLASLVLALVVGVFAHAELGFGATAVLSDSMRPSYQAGDVMITKLTPVAELKVGEVVVVTPPGQSAPVAHRIIALSGDPKWPTLRTKGDANRVARAFRRASRLGQKARHVRASHNWSMAEGEASDRSRDEKIGQVEEVKRRLRRDGFSEGRGERWFFSCAVYDVTVTIAPPNARLAARVAEFCPDIAIKVRHGVCERSYRDTCVLQRTL